jgi:restriction system protein
MTRFYRVSLGKAGANAAQAKAEGWAGTGWMSNIDLTGTFPDEWRDFNKKYIPIAMVEDGIQSKVGAGLACGMTWTVSKGLEIGDFVLSTTADSSYFQIGKVTGKYFYAKGQVQPHRRPVEWQEALIAKSELSEELLKSISAGTVQDFTRFADELTRFTDESDGIRVSVNQEDVENPFTFVMEKYLEDFLVSNWKHTELGRDYEIFEVDGEKVGQQYPSDTGPIDILAISKDKKTILVVELKRGKVSDVVVGQIQRYMGFVKDELCEPGQSVKGIIIGLDDDRRIQRALSVTQNIEFYRYEVNFRLTK